MRLFVSLDLPPDVEDALFPAGWEAPGSPLLRKGAVSLSGDERPSAAAIRRNAALLKQFLLYRTYHGSAMSPSVQSASIVAWNDEKHVEENRDKYIRKFNQVTPLLKEVLDVELPDAGFYLWARVDKLTQISDVDYAKRLYAEYNVTVLPGSYLAREAPGPDGQPHNPGAGRVRMALVAEPSLIHLMLAVVELLNRLVYWAT